MICTHASSDRFVANWWAVVFVVAGTGGDLSVRTAHDFGLVAVDTAKRWFFASILMRGWPAMASDLPRVLHQRQRRNVLDQRPAQFPVLGLAVAKQTADKSPARRRGASCTCHGRRFGLPLSASCGASDGVCTSPQTGGSRFIGQLGVCRWQNTFSAYQADRGHRRSRSCVQQKWVG